MTVRRSRLAGRARGVASVEAIAALPVFLALFIGLRYLDALLTAEYDADNTARTCAWIYSANDCETLPPGCDGIVSANGQGADGITRALDDASAQLQGVSGAVAGVVDDLLKGAVAAALGRSSTAVASFKVQRPKLLGGGFGVKKRKYDLPCNLHPETPEDVAKDVWKLLSP